MSRDSVSPSGVDFQNGPFGHDKVGPLLRGLRDPAQAVRTGALRALVRLPLREEVWMDVGGFIWRELARPVTDDVLEFQVEPTIPRHELIEAAVYVPIDAIRRQLHELIEMGTEEERHITAYALARARDPAAIPQLVADLSSPDDPDEMAAEHLSYLDVTPVRDVVRNRCQEDPSGNVRFWLAVALARLGETAFLGRILKGDMGEEPVEERFSLMDGDPYYLADRMAARGPFPQAVTDLFRGIAADEGYSGYLRLIAEVFLYALERDALTEEEAVPPTRETRPVLDEDGDLRKQAADLAANYLDRSPFEERGELPWEDRETLSHLEPELSTLLVTALFTHIVRDPSVVDPCSAGNSIIYLIESLRRPFVPDVPALFEICLEVQAHDLGLGCQLAWTVSRAGLRCVLADLAPRFAAPDEEERAAAARLVEEVSRYVRAYSGPVFGAGGGAGPRDIPPQMESFIEFERQAAAVDGEPRAQPEPRWLQGQLFEIAEGREIRLDRALRAGALHRLVVRIGSADEEWITAPEDAAIPIEELPADQDEYELRIIFCEPNHVPQPLIDTIYLPRLRGNSTTCEFQFRTQRDVPEFEGRVIVAYGEHNRILQTMFLVAHVLPDPAQAPPEATIEFKPETSVRANLSDLDSRPQLDVALVADTGSDGVTHLTEIASERVELRSLENVEAPIRSIRRRLSRIADAPEDFPRDLNARPTVRLLRFLARQGKLLYNGIVRTQLGDSPLLTAKRIQLVSARESFLPLEFMYERPSPTADATLCPNAREALETGKCTHCDQTEAEAAKAYICPLGFWCMNRVIERHAIKPVAETNLSGTEYALQTDPVTGRDTLDVLNVAVYAASDHVKEEQIEELLQTLLDVTGQRVEHVQDWDAWRTAVQNHQPSMLVLVPHTLEDDDYIPTLEIGDKQQLPGDQITVSYVHATHDYQPPIVLLLGCETAVPDVPFQGFAVQFRIHGAAIVLSTLTPVLGRHAVPVAQLLLNELKHAACAQGTFGDALLMLRRRGLAAGIPMVLSLVAYGDADWRLNSDANRRGTDEP